MLFKNRNRLRGRGILANRSYVRNPMRKNGKLAAASTTLIAAVLAIVGTVAIVANAAAENIPVTEVSDNDVIDGMYSPTIEYTSVSIESGFRYVSDVTNYCGHSATSPAPGYVDKTSAWFDQFYGHGAWMFEINASTPKSRPTLRFKGANYNGQSVDALVTIADWTYLEPVTGGGWSDSDHYESWVDFTPCILMSESWKALSDSDNGKPQNFNFYSVGIKNYKVEVKYVRAGTNTVVPVKGHMTTVDLDWGQQFGFGGAVKRAYIPSNTDNLYRVGNYIAAGDDVGLENDPISYRRGLVETVFETSSSDPTIDLYFNTSWTGSNPTTPESFFAMTTDTIVPFDWEDPTVVTKSVDITEGATVGDILTYTINYKAHQWGVDCRWGWRYDSLSIIDELPEELSYVDGSATMYKGSSRVSAGSASYSSGSHTLTYKFSSSYLSTMDMNNGDTYRLVFKAKIDKYPDNGNMYVINGCHAVYNGNTLLGNDVRTDLIGAQMSLTKSPKTQHISGNDVAVGKQITWTINVSNDGQVPITNINIDDKLPGATVNYGSWDKSLDAGEDQDVTVTYALTKDDIVRGSVHNTAIATGDWANGDVTSNEDYADVTIDNSPELTLEKTPPTQTVKGTDAVIGHEISWVIKVTNTGNVPLTNVTIDDHLDGANVDTSGFDGNLAVGASHDFNVTYALTKEDIVRGTVDNTAIAHGDWVGGDVDSNEDTAHVDIENDPELTLTKDPKSQTIDDAHAVPGTSVSWTITVENTGQVEVTNVTVDESALPGCTVSPSSPVSGVHGDV